MINLWRSLRFTVVFAVLLGLVYPLFVMGIGNVLFPFQAQGSMVKVNGTVVGSELIAQATTAPGLFHPRPSAVHYAGNNSGGSNLGPTNPALITEVKGNLQQVLSQNPGVTTSQVPPDMVESSASGLDPNISIADAELQIPRIAKATGLSNGQLQNMITENETGRLFGIWGVSMVNVMQLNEMILQFQGKQVVNVG